MSWPKENGSKYSRAKQALATLLSLAIIGGALPPPAFSAPAAAGAPVRHLRLLPAALPPAPPMPAPPLPTPAPPSDEEARKWGEITVGQPKVWQYERMNSLLDGLLRDVQGVSMSDLIALDANATNGAAVKFVQSMLEIGVQYNQGAAVTNKIALQNYATAQSVASTQIQANSAYLQQLNQQRDTLSSELADAMEQNRGLQTQLATTSLDPNSADYKALAARQQAAASEVTTLQADLTSVNSQITSASTTTMPAAPNLTSTTGGTAPENPNTFGSFLGNLPADLTKNIVSQLQSPSLPATKRMDNFMTLLYERLAREISALQDDVMRDPDNVPYLVKFDVSLHPSARDSNHVAVAEFTLGCLGCKVYSIYPGQSSYNVANYEGVSKRYSLWGALATIFGFGINADYRRQTDTLHGDLVQSVYMSGFQEAATIPNPTAPPSPQRFGWYYGAAPFETLVTQGERTTFALISIPRRLLKDCSDEMDREYGNHPSGFSMPCSGGELHGSWDRMGIKKITAAMNVETDWVRRDNPDFQKPGWWYLWFRKHARAQGDSRLDRAVGLELPGADGLNEIPEVVLAERSRLHVLGMEYNPVYYTPAAQPQPGAPSPVAPQSAGGVVAAPATGGNAATAAKPSTTPITTTGTPAVADPLTGCKQDQCAAVLLRLAEPVDPNLVVTVRGLPLRRVRDWRGRATSVLPPAQSASDLTSPSALNTSGAGSLAGRPVGAENAPSASLFEVDAPGPDTWMEVDSHRILLNVSRTLAGERSEFPTIQIVDPAKRALFIPLDLDTGFSELITNGFRFTTRNGEQLWEYLCDHLHRDPVRCRQNQLASDTLLQTYPPAPTSLPTERLSSRETMLVATRVNKEADGTNRLGPGVAYSNRRASSDLHPAGPYAYETFLPLFLPRRDEQPIYAYLGETGTEILVGLESVKPDPLKTGPPPKPKSWLAGEVQVVLEDAYLDLAWSLSCYPQSPMLVCNVPRQEIRDAYAIVSRVCTDETACPSFPNLLDKSLTISSLRVWVDQYDPDGNDSFHSSAPAVIGRFPVQPKNGAGPDVGYRPWYFESASTDWVKLTGCNYPEFSDNDEKASQAVTILGRGISPNYRTQVLQTGVEAGCKWFVIPTLALTYPEVVIEYPRAEENSRALTGRTTIPFTAQTPDPCTRARQASRCLPESLSTSLFQPSFQIPVAIPGSISSVGNTPIINQWTIDIPAGRVDCNDRLGIRNGMSKFSPKWRVGVFTTPVQDLSGSSTGSCLQQLRNSAVEQANAEVVQAQAAEKSAKTAGEKATAAAQLEAAINKQKAISSGTAGIPDWDEASKTSQIGLELDVNRRDLASLPLKQNIQVLRGPFLSLIGKLPDLRPSFLPTQLNVVATGPNKFVLQGDNAGLIDAVTVQGPDGTRSTIPVVSSAQTAFVTVPESGKPAAKPSAPLKPVISRFSKDSVPGGTKVEIHGSDFGPDPGTVKFGEVTAVVDSNCWTPDLIAVDVPKNAQPGSVDVTVETKGNGLAPKVTKKFTVAEKPLDRIEPTSCSPPSAQGSGSNSGGPKAGAYSIVPLIALSWDANGNVQQYLPLDVVDSSGKPLSFTVAEQKAAGTTASKGVDSPTTTLTISKKTTVTPAPSTSNTTPGQ